MFVKLWGFGLIWLKWNANNWCKWRNCSVSIYGSTGNTRDNEEFEDIMRNRLSLQDNEAENIEVCQSTDFNPTTLIQVVIEFKRRGSGFDFYVSRCNSPLNFRFDFFPIQPNMLLINWSFSCLLKTDLIANLCKSIAEYFERTETTTVEHFHFMPINFCKGLW